MNNRLKRYRQTSIIESFAFCKRQKTNCTSLNVNADRQFELAGISATSEEMMTSSLNLEEATNNICQVTEDSILNVNTDTQIELAATSDDSEEEIELPSLDELINSICPVAEDSVEIKSENEINVETWSANTEIHKQYSDSSIFQNSADLFPEESPSLEDYSIPSSSHSDGLFAESSDNEASKCATTSETSDSEELEQLSYLNITPGCSFPLPKLEPLGNHTILFSPHILPGLAPRPYPSSYRDKWDSEHVRMPCSPFNRYPVDNGMGEKRIESRWNIICRSLRSNIESSKDLETAIMKYNSQYIGKWSFLGLHDFINEHLTEEERDHFFEVILPVMVEMALDLPNVCTQSIPLLKKGKDHYITMSQKQIGCLLLNAFFCTYPRRTLPGRYYKQRFTLEYATYPDINFNRLFYGTKRGIPCKNAEKLKCLFNYFQRIASEEPSGTITFHRQIVQDEFLPRWHISSRGIRNAVVKSSGLIESDGHGMLQVDFANKFVGGGVLGQGCVQEEIRFIICPELIISRLFVECLSNNEVLIVTGVEQYNKYSGYSDTFKWEGNFKDKTPRDSWGRRYTRLVAMDAIHFTNPDDQYKFQFVKRELNKAYCAFYEDASSAHLPAVATGNWGCGAFKGNSHLKFLIQLMAASQAGRSLLYFTFGNKKLKRQLQNMYDFLNDKNLAVGDVWRLLMCYAESISLFNKRKYSNLYDFISAQFENKEEITDDSSSAELNLDDSDKRAVQNLIEAVTQDGSSTEIEDIT